MDIYLNIAAAVFALIAAVFWWRSACRKLPPFPSMVYDFDPNKDPFFLAVRFSANMNKIAAGSSFISAVCVAILLVLPPPPNITLDLQRKCAEQAVQMFPKYIKDIQLNLTNHDVPAEYINHYNKKYQKCFMLVRFSNELFGSHSIATNRRVIDAFEGSRFAEYKSINGSSNPDVCEILLPEGNKEKCESSEQFDELIRIFMEK